MKTYSTVMTGAIHEALSMFLVRTDQNEDLCFATYVPSTGKDRFTAVVTNVILPETGQRQVHGNASFNPEYLERVIQIATARQEGIAFLHSHLGPGWQDMSDDDVRAEQRMAPAAMGATGYPLLGLTIGTDGAWSARFWTKDPSARRSYQLNWCSTVRVIDKSLRVTYHEDLMVTRLNRDRQIRTISAWGPKVQGDISRLTVGIVGLGSVGSIVAEILARTGFSHFVLIDFDSVELKNLDRLTGVFDPDIGRAKVEAVAEAIRKSASASEIDIAICEHSVSEKEGYLTAMDCDILVSCVDRPWGRQVLNFISYAHLIPVVDGGILVRTNRDNTRLIGADWKTHMVGYGRPCLECLGQYKAEDAAAEKAGYLDDPAYIQGLEKGSVIDAHENVFAFSAHLASSIVLQILQLVLQPGAISSPQTYHFVTGELDHDYHCKCQNHCFAASILAKGDHAGVTLYDDHPLAAAARAQRASSAQAPIREPFQLGILKRWKNWLSIAFRITRKLKPST